MAIVNDLKKKFISMKKIIYLLGIVSLLCGCENRDIEFPDFEYQTVYFPHQTPVRTIMLGDEVLGDNSIDLEHAFSIGAAIGGMYNNNKDREITVEFAPELAANINYGTGTVLELMPSAYYNATFDKIIIPAGQFFGKLKVNLTDAFFADTLATGLRYVIPLRIIDAKGDSILSGKTAGIVPTPDPRIASHWAVTPQNYVLFGVKYINPTHGVYLLRGKRKNLTNPLDSAVYSARFLDDNDFTKLTTRSLTESYMSTVGGTNKEVSNAKYSMKLIFDEVNKSVTVTRRNANTVAVTGTGKFYSRADAQSESYNGKKHRTIYLNYTYIDGANEYQVNDSLVFVDTDVKFETFAVNVVNP
ncbi:MAG: DUF1735 domain-containing protein [Bacteroidales bacterium]|nr:DUF1735 domain-containing protein [Bacteroidales bacterium]